MTCIIWHKNKLYADSMFQKDGELFQSMSKIQSIQKPFKIKSEEIGFRFNDTVHAWTGTGGFPAMMAFVNSLKMDAEQFDEAKGTISFYTLAVEQQLIARMANVFEVFLIGEEANHSFAVNVEGFKYTRYDKKVSITFGSGYEVCMTYLKQHKDPLRALFETFMIDKHSGGHIDVWSAIERDDDKPFVFCREGIMTDVPRGFLRQYLDIFFPDKKVPIPLAFVRRSHLERELMNAASHVLELEKKLELSEKRNRTLLEQKRAAKQPAAKKAAPKVVSEKRAVKS